MKQIKLTVFVITFFLFMSFLIPSIVVLPFSSKEPNEKMDHSESLKVTKQTKSDKEAYVSVLRTGYNKVENLPLEEYVVGVVASEMPADFEEEALKAQALTARTYIVGELTKNKNEMLPKGANVTDTIKHQVYKNKEELKKIWGKDYDWKIKRVTKAVKATEGEVLIHNNKPITAAFFSTSNGFTENSSDYWEDEVPYLKSVESPWDKKSPKFTDQKTIPISEFEKKLGVNLDNSKDVGTIISRTAGKRISKVNINGKEFSGREIREKLDLRSSDFSWVRKGDKIVISTKGYGHGVGMSQYGANGMAQEGKTYKDIVHHYYDSVEISNVSSFLQKIMAKK